MLRRSRWLSLLALTLPLLFAGSRVSGQRVQQDLSPVLKDKLADDYIGALALVQENYAGKVDFETVAKSSIVGMLRTLDPHSLYFDKQQWQTFQNEQRSRYYGIGATIGQRNNKVYILSPADGTPARRAGLRFGDEITAIDGQSSKGLTSLQVRQKLLGPEGTTVTVQVSRLGVSDPVEAKITRAAVPLPSVTNLAIVGKGIGYIYLQRGFNTTTLNEMRNAIQELREQGMTSLILDVRGNPGGLVDQAWRVADLFLYSGQKVLSMRGRPGVFPSREFPALNSSPHDYPLVVLVNRGTASAPEILAGALQDHDRAIIVGERSFGKGLVQNPFVLSDGSALILTTGRYYTPSGRSLQREYNGRSAYDYYSQRGDQGTTGDERRTDSGRVVYGGGGISPDVAVKTPTRQLELQRRWLEPVFEFSRALVAGQIAGHTDFKIDKPADLEHRLSTKDYAVDDKVLAAFKKFIAARKDLKVDESRIDKDADFIKLQIRHEVITAAYGLDTAYEVLLGADPQMQQAIAEVPKAKQMADAIVRLRAERVR